MLLLLKLLLVVLIIPATFLSWTQVRLPDGGRLPVVLLANKCDLDIPIDR